MTTLSPSRVRRRSADDTAEVADVALAAAGTQDGDGPAEATRARVGLDRQVRRRIEGSPAQDVGPSWIRTDLGEGSSTGPGTSARHNPAGDEAMSGVMEEGRIEADRLRREFTSTIGQLSPPRPRVLPMSSPSSPSLAGIESGAIPSSTRIGWPPAPGPPTFIRPPVDNGWGQRSSTAVAGSSLAAPPSGPSPVASPFPASSQPFGVTPLFTPLPAFGPDADSPMDESFAPAFPHRGSRTAQAMDTFDAEDAVGGDAWRGVRPGSLAGTPPARDDDDDERGPEAGPSTARGSVGSLMFPDHPPPPFLEPMLEDNRPAALTVFRINGHDIALPSRLSALDPIIFTTTLQREVNLWRRLERARIDVVRGPGESHLDTNSEDAWRTFRELEAEWEQGSADRVLSADECWRIDMAWRSPPPGLAGGSGGPSRSRSRGARNRNLSLGGQPVGLGANDGASSDEDASAEAAVARTATDLRHRRLLREDLDRLGLLRPLQTASESSSALDDGAEDEDDDETDFDAEKELLPPSSSVRTAAPPGPGEVWARAMERRQSGSGGSRRTKKRKRDQSPTHQETAPSTSGAPTRVETVPGSCWSSFLRPSMLWSGTQMTMTTSKVSGLDPGPAANPMDFQWIRQMIDAREMEQAARNVLNAGSGAGSSSSARTRPRSNNVNSDAHGARTSGGGSSGFQDITAQQALNNAISQMSARSQRGELFGSLAPVGTSATATGSQNDASSGNGGGATLHRASAIRRRRVPDLGSALRPPHDLDAADNARWISLFSRHALTSAPSEPADATSAPVSRRQFALPRSQVSLAATLAAAERTSDRATKFNSSWEVQAALTGIDPEAGMVTGVMRALGVKESSVKTRRRASRSGEPQPPTKEEVQEVLTGFEGEVVDFGKKGIWSGTVPKEVDLEHWMQTPPFRHLTRSMAVMTFLNVDEVKHVARDYVLMRWKGASFVCAALLVTALTGSCF